MDGAKANAVAASVCRRRRRRRRTEAHAPEAPTKLDGLVVAVVVAGAVVDNMMMMK